MATKLHGIRTSQLLPSGFIYFFLQEESVCADAVGEESCWVGEERLVKVLKPNHYNGKGLLANIGHMAIACFP